ncbi:GNAT family N-acetyltransferase [Salinimicrobium sediminilitoris]|uniref:GNAT family N-acetyltransferase n=1 Tax=Salinimicrobium sediminilitoris TaxID=2876715 RepID=UPI001E3BC34A|nr:GNAT family N-acetyltransferase [Salinimicrobium sediminilitoris]MCC8359521.1 GNAT family N-acetyltransferase [Salinimicrobium sediminilitoris]
MEIKILTFEELSLHELYKVLQLRAEVFVVEQDCVYQDIDGKDEKALHILGFEGEELVAYTRIFPPGIYFSQAAIGRVVVKEGHRKKSYGHEILKASIQAVEEKFDTKKIKLSAQTYLTKFYESHGFKQVGEGYLEDGIPHIGMVKD